MGQNDEKKKFMLCIENKDCDDLERRKIYQADWNLNTYLLCY